MNGSQRKYKFGFVIGRFQTPHIGHEHLIRTAKELCENLLVLVGSAQESGTTRNPFKVSLRETMLKKLFDDVPNVYVARISDLTNENDHSHEWGKYLLNRVKILGKYYGITDELDCMIYGNDEERNGWFDQKDIEGVTQIRLDRADIPISATQMRGYMAWNQRDLWEKNINPKLHGFYDTLRQELWKIQEYKEPKMTEKHESLYKTKWVELMQRTSDKDGTYIYIREPWLIDGKAISILPYRRDEAGYIQFLLRGEMAEMPVFGTVKGGMDKEGETPRQCAVRELLEEAGYTADETQLIALGQCRTSKLNTTRMYLFAVDVTNLPHEEPKGDGTANEANAYCQWVSEVDAIGYQDPVIHTTMLRLYNWANQQEGDV